MLLNGFLIVIGIILFSILTVLCIVFSIVYFANSKKGRFGWLAAFFVSLIALLFCIYMLANKVINKAKDFAASIENSMIQNLDSAPYDSYNLADSVNSKQIQYLKKINSQGFVFNPSEQFYNYLGFRDYYRMPIRYPYSIHCTDSLDKGSLFDEIDVQKFDANDNGEKDCKVNNIVSFVFDKNYLLLKTSELKNNKEKILYLIYNFDSQEIEEFKTIEAMTIRAKEFQFSRPIKLVNCKDYYGLF